MSFLSQAPPLGGLAPPHGAFQEHAAHVREWSMTLSSKGSLGTCIPKGVSTFFHTAFTAHSEARADAVCRRLHAIVRGLGGYAATHVEGTGTASVFPAILPGGPWVVVTVPALVPCARL